MHQWLIPPLGVPLLCGIISRKVRGNDLPTSSLICGFDAGIGFLGRFFLSGRDLKSSLHSIESEFIPIRMDWPNAAPGSSYLY